MNFIKRIFSPSCLTVSVLLLLYTYYKSEIFWNGLNNEYYLVYYILFFLFFIFSIISFFINRKIKEYLIISFISGILVIFLFEGYLIFKTKTITKENIARITKENITKIKLYEKKTAKKYDTRTMLQIYEDLKKTDHNYTLLLHPHLNPVVNKYKIFPLSGVSNSKTIFCNENGYYSIYESDKYGFNNPNIEWDNKDLEYLLVGDSFAHGACVNRPNDIASVLRTLSKKSVINLGFSSNGPLMEYATLREYLVPNVKKVLWIYYPNDLNDLQYEISNSVLIKYLNDLNFTQKLKFKQNKIDDLINNTIKNKLKFKSAAQEERFDNNKFISFIKITKFRKLIFSLIIERSNFEKILKLTKDLTLSNNSKLYFVYLPEFNHNKKNFSRSDYTLIKKIVNKLDITFIDIYSEVFEKEENPLVFFPFGLNGHYNVEGYKKIAETIYKSTER